MTAAWVSSLIFLITIAVLLTDWVHRTIVVWVGAAVMLAVGLAMGFYTQGQALAAIDFNTLGLLLGMMMLMAMFRNTGAVEALAILAAQKARGSPVRLLAILGGLTTIISMLLNNATVILLLAPVTIMVAAHLKISPVPWRVGEAFLFTVGGTATLIGDPPNVLIGSAAGLTFNDFLIVLLPVVLVAYYPTLWTIRWLFAAELQKRAGRSADLLPSRPRDSIKDRAGLAKLLVVLGLMLALFTLQDALHLQLAVRTSLGVALAMPWLLPNPGARGTRTKHGAVMVGPGDWRGFRGQCQAHWGQRQHPHNRAVRARRVSHYVPHVAPVGNHRRPRLVRRRHDRVLGDFRTAEAVSSRLSWAG